MDKSLDFLMLIHLSRGLLPSVPLPCSSRGGKKQEKDVCKALWEKKAIYRRTEARGHGREMQRVSQGPLGGGGTLAPSCRNPMGRLSESGLDGQGKGMQMLGPYCGIPAYLSRTLCSTSYLVTSD